MKAIPIGKIVILLNVSDLNNRWNKMALAYLKSQREGWYQPKNDPDEPLPCSCQPSCPSNCKGECGCAACHAAYQDFLSAE